MTKNRANFACVLAIIQWAIMTKKFLVLASFLGLNLLIGACQPTTQTPTTTTPPATTATPTTPPATTPPPAVPPAATPTPGGSPPDTATPGASPPATTPAPGTTP